MNTEKLFNADEVCKQLNISIYTLRNWYNWEKKACNGEPYLPQPIRMEHTKGKPRMWTKDMIKELKIYKKNIVTGRNGVFGIYSNPMHKETKKYKKSLQNNKCCDTINT